jgi:hypothetical protein
MPEGHYRFLCAALHVDPDIRRHAFSFFASLSARTSIDLKTD